MVIPLPERFFRAFFQKTSRIHSNPLTTMDLGFSHPNRRVSKSIRLKEQTHQEVNKLHV